jgi:hypothetical protein
MTPLQKLQYRKIVKLHRSKYTHIYLTPHGAVWGVVTNLITWSMAGEWVCSHKRTTLHDFNPGLYAWDDSFTNVTEQEIRDSLVVGLYTYENEKKNAKNRVKAVLSKCKK